MKKLLDLFKSLCFVMLLFIAWSCEPKEEEVKVLKEYTVIFNSNGGSAIASIKVQEHTKLTKPSINPVKGDSTFVEWQLGGKNYDFNTPVTGHITLTAIYEEKVSKEYTVTFNSNGGSVINPIKVKNKTKLTKPSVDPVKEGHVFIEWQLGGEKYDFNTLVTGDITLTTVWSFVEWETVDIGSGGVKLTRYLGKATAIVIPESVRGKEILEIGVYIFGQSKNIVNTSITGVDMSKATKLRAIGYRAFAYCFVLTSITLPSSLTAIGDRAFEDCRTLTSITFPTSSALTAIGGSAFYSCSSLTSVMLPSSVSAIGYNAFYSCSSLTSVTLPSGLITIEGGAFQNCTSLTGITLPSSLTTIGVEVFAYCSSLTSITLPSSLTTIGERSFYGCTSLTSITPPNSVTAIGQRAFQNCTSLTGITLPRSLTTIESNTFEDCSSLTSVTLPSGLISTGTNAFKGCYRLASITLPSSLTTIEGEAFRGCSSLTLVTLQRSANPLTSITSSTFQNTPLTSSSMTATIRHPSLAAYNTADGWKDLLATFEVKQ